jgi:hypothetical protein
MGYGNRQSGIEGITWIKEKENKVGESVHRKKGENRREKKSRRRHRLHCYALVRTVGVIYSWVAPFVLARSSWDDRVSQPYLSHKILKRLCYVPILSCTRLIYGQLYHKTGGWSANVRRGERREKRRDSPWVEDRPRLQG